MCRRSTMERVQERARGTKRLPERINYEHCSRSEETVGCTRLWSLRDEEKVKRAGKLCRNKNARVCRWARLWLRGLTVANSQREGGRRDEVGIESRWRRPAAHKLHEKQGRVGSFAVAVPAMRRALASLRVSARSDRKRALKSADGRTDQWQGTDRWRTAPQANISRPKINISCAAASIPLPSFP